MQEDPEQTNSARPCATRALLLLALLFLLLHFTTLRVGLNGDSQSHLFLAASLVHTGNFDLRSFESMLTAGGSLPYFIIEADDGSLRSIFNFFPSLLLAPFFLAGRFLVPGFESNLHLWAYIGSALARLMIFGAGFALWFLARPRYGTFPALMAVAAFWFASSLAPSAIDYLQHHPLALFKLLAFLILFGPGGLSPNKGRAFVGGLMLAAAVLSRYQALPSLALIALLVCYWNRHNRANLLCFLAGGASLIPAFLLYHHAAFGSPFQLGPNPYLSFDAPFLATTSALLFNPSKGLIIHSPWMLLALLAPWFMFRQFKAGNIDRLALACCVSIVPTLLLYGRLNGWFGGWSWGPRYMSEIVPEIAILFAVALSHIGQQALSRVIAFALLLIGIIIALVGQFGYDHQWHGRHDLGVGPYQDWLWQTRHNQPAYYFRQGDLYLLGGRRFSLWDSPYESHGLYEEEDWGEVSARWTEGQTRFYFVPTSAPPTLHLLPNPSGQEVTVTLTANRQRKRLVLEPGNWSGIAIPRAQFQRGVIIELSVSPTHPESSEGGRTLGVAIDTQTGHFY